MASLIAGICVTLAILLAISNTYSSTSQLMTDFLGADGYDSAKLTSFVQNNLIYHIIAIIYIFVIYRFRFAEWGAQTEKPLGYPPRPARHFTSWLRFEIWAALYAATGVVILYLVYHYPQVLTFLQDVQAGAAGAESAGASNTRQIEQALSDGGQAAAAPYSQRLTLGVAAAVALAFVPKLEPSLRAAFQRAALIPANATVLVDEILDRFDRFRPDPEDVEAFLIEHNAQRLPNLFAEEFRHNLVNQNFLEVYPRLEFIRWKFKRLANDRRFRTVFNEYRQDLNDLEKEFGNLRTNLLALSDSMRTFFGPQQEARVAATHAAAGIDRPDEGPIATTLFDDLLTRGATPKPGPTTTPSAATQLREEAAPFDALPAVVQDWLADKDRQMQSDLRERLKLVSEDAQRLYARLVQLTVFAALGSKVLNPRQALHEFGLEVEVADRVTFDWNHFVGVSVAMLAVLFTATVTYFWLGTPAGSDGAGSSGGGEVMLWTLCGLSLLVGGLAGGYAVGLFMLNNKLGRRRGATKLTFSNVDMAISAATAWATSVIAYALTGLLLGLGQLAPTGWMWGFVPGVFGATLALAAHRIKAGRPIWPLRYVVQLGAATVLAVLVTLLFTVEFDPRRLVADPGFVFYVMATSLVCAIWFGLLLRTWHRQHVTT